MSGIFAAIMIIIAGLFLIYTGKVIYPITILLALIIIPSITKYFIKGDSAPLYDMLFIFGCIPIMVCAAIKFEKIGKEISHN